MPEIVEFRPCDLNAVHDFFADVLADLGFQFDLESKDRDLYQITDVYQSAALRPSWANPGTRIRSPDR
jgi:hypothetical protein